MKIKITASKAAARHGFKKPYLARLEMAGNGVDRRFAPRVKINNGHYGFEIDTRPGDVIEARNHVWSHERQAFEGGTHWFVDDGHAARQVSRDDAMMFVSTSRLDGGNAVALNGPAAEQMEPPGVTIGAGRLSLA